MPIKRDGAGAAHHRRASNATGNGGFEIRVPVRE